MLKLIAGLSLTLSVSITAFAKGSSAGLKIPVRFAFLAGYNSSSNFFKDNLEKNSLSAPGIGAEFSVPFRAANFSVGLGGWLFAPGKTGDSTVNTMYLLDIYARYLGTNYDFFVGPGIAAMSAKTEKTDAAPNTSIHLQGGSMGCGVMGGRYFFGKDIAAGIGLTAYYCMSGSYKKTLVDASQNSTETTIEERASATGGLAFLFFEWNEERTLF